MSNITPTKQINMLDKLQKFLILSSLATFVSGFTLLATGAEFKQIQYWTIIMHVMTVMQATIYGIKTRNLSSSLIVGLFAVQFIVITYLSIDISSRATTELLVVLEKGLEWQRFNVYDWFSAVVLNMVIVKLSKQQDDIHRHT